MEGERKRERGREGNSKTHLLPEHINEGHIDPEALTAFNDHAAFRAGTSGLSTDVGLV